MKEGIWKGKKKRLKMKGKVGSMKSTQNKVFLSPRMLQSVRRHSAAVLTVTINGM